MTFIYILFRWLWTHHLSKQLYKRFLTSVWRIDNFIWMDFRNSLLSRQWVSFSKEILQLTDFYINRFILYFRDAENNKIMLWRVVRDHGCLRKKCALLELLDCSSRFLHPQRTTRGCPRMRRTFHQLFSNAARCHHVSATTCLLLLGSVISWMHKFITPLGLW